MSREHVLVDRRHAGLGALLVLAGCAAPPEKVYRAFIDADALARWLPPNGYTCRVHHLEAKVGGTFRMPSHESRNIDPPVSSGAIAMIVASEEPSPATTAAWVPEPGWQPGLPQARLSAVSLA